MTEPIFRDTQFIVFRDTIAPHIFCPVGGAVGSINNPYRFPTTFNTCSGLPGNINVPTGTDACDDNMSAIITGVYRLSDNRLLARDLTFLDPLEVGAYRVAYVLRDDCGNTSAVCNIYFDIVDQTTPTAICSDELIVSLAFGDIEITAAEIGKGSYDACGLDTLFVRRTICGSDTEYPETINPLVAQKFGTDADANGWVSSITIGCCDMNTIVKVQLLIFDKSGNYNKCWFCLLYTSPSPRDRTRSRMPSSA